MKHDHPPPSVERRRRWLAAAATAATGALLPWPAIVRAQADEAKAPALPAPGTRLVLPAAELLDGSRFEPAGAEGRVFVLYWWASWCPFCALTSPHIDRLWQQQRQRPGGQGLQLLTFSIDKHADDARAYLHKRGYAWPTAWMGPALQRAFPKPKGLPVTVVRGRDGRVLQAEGGQLFPEDVESLARHAA